MYNNAMPRGVYVRKEETKRRISAALTGRIIFPDWRAKISASKMGRETSPETRARLSASGMGHDVSPETRAKIAIARAGKPTKPGRLGADSPRWKGGQRAWKGRANAKRRGLGSNPLNSWFPDSDGHHLSDGVTVIYMPHSMHSGKGNYHNHNTGQGMARMDALAGAFFTEDWT